MKVIATTNAPGAIGPYSQGFEVNGFVYTSGQIPVNPENGHPEGSGADFHVRAPFLRLSGVVSSRYCLPRLRPSHPVSAGTAEDLRGAVCLPHRLFLRFLLPEDREIPKREPTV